MIVITIAHQNRKHFVKRWTPGEEWPRAEQRFGLLPDALYLVTAQGVTSIEWVRKHCLGIRDQPGDRRNSAIAWTGEDAIFILNSLYKFPEVDLDIAPPHRI